MQLVQMEDSNDSHFFFSFFLCSNSSEEKSIFKQRELKYYRVIFQMFRTTKYYQPQKLIQVAKIASLLSVSHFEFITYLDLLKFVAHNMHLNKSTYLQIYIGGAEELVVLL